MPAALKMLAHSSWLRLGSRLYERMVLMPNCCIRAASRRQLSLLLSGSRCLAGSYPEEPPGWYATSNDLESVAIGRVDEVVVFDLERQHGRSDGQAPSTTRAVCF